MRLSELAASLAAAGLLATDLAPGPAASTGGADPEITGVAFDSRQVEPGQLFCCLRGEHGDGHDHAGAAVAAGAAALLVERRLDVAVPQLQVAEARPAMARLAVAFHGDPARSLTVIGITGTNGKTTTTYLLRAIFEAAGLTGDVVGTLSGARTTPEAPELQARLAAMRDQGVQAVAMEVSSHALAQHRVDGTWFSVAAFTNLSRDHLDFHGTMEAYFEVKAQLFSPEFTDRAVVNLDNPYGRLLADAAKVPTTGFSLDQLDDLQVTPTGSTFGWRGHPVRLALAGRFNVANALAAAESARAAGLDPAAVAAGLSAPLVVPGRFERIEAGQPFTVVVDYAHTPDGLEQVLVAAGGLHPDGRVIVVFGCGGDRDATKRPAMGRVAAEHADRVILTSDNSRGEDTGAIIDAVKQGYDQTPRPGGGRRSDGLLIEADRAAAIAEALDAARPGDVVVVAGKGHETTQTLGGVTAPFDDRQVVRQLLARRPGADS